MKRGKLFWGIGLITLAVVLILDAFGLTVSLKSAVGEISLLAVLAGIFLISCIVSELMHRRIGSIFVPLSFLFMVFEKNISFLCRRSGEDLINNWLLFGCAILLWIGFSLLFPAKRLHLHKPRAAIGKHRGRNLSSSVYYIDAATLQNECAENNMGSLVVRFENAEQYAGGGTLTVENNMGSIVVEIPAVWRYTYKVENNLGHITAEPNRAGESAPMLNVFGENNLGSIVLKLV